MEAKWRTKKRSLAALAAASPTAKRSSTEEPKVVAEAAVVSNVASNPSATALPSAEASAESDDPEIVQILSGEETVHAAPLASVVLETDESVTASDASADGHDNDEPSVDNWLMPESRGRARGRCLGSVIEDGVELRCEEETNGSSQLCHYCTRGIRPRVW